MMLVSAPLAAAPQAPVSQACMAADAAVVGHVHRGPVAATADVTVLQVIKGQSVANTILPVQLPRFPPGRAESGDDFTAIVFLKQDGSNWRIRSFAGDSAPLQEQMLPAKEGNAMSGACEDQIFARTLAALNDGNVAWYRMPVLGWFVGFDSVAYREQLGALSHAANPEFRAMGLEGRFALGDIAALQQVQTDAAMFGAATLSELGLLLSGYRNPDLAGIAELGKIAGMSGQKYTGLVQAAASSLSAVHTPDTLPGLYRLLDNSDPEVRQEAMYGFASFVANFPILRTEDVPSNRHITPLPRGRYSTGDGDGHFPRAGSDNQDTLAFWRAWYEANFKTAH